MRGRKGERTGHDSKYGPFPATNNNARLVFYFIFLSYTRIYIKLLFSSEYLREHYAVSVGQSRIPDQCDEGVHFFTLCVIATKWKMGMRKSERTNGFCKWRDDTVLNCIPLKLLGRTLNARRYNHIKNWVKIIIMNFRILLSFLVRLQPNMKCLFNLTKIIILFYCNLNNFKHCILNKIPQYLTQTLHLYVLNNKWCTSYLKTIT